MLIYLHGVLCFAYVEVLGGNNYGRSTLLRRTLSSGLNASHASTIARK
jgi:hypothetical protein